jgi:hypothetical protein
MDNAAIEPVSFSLPTCSYFAYSFSRCSQEVVGILFSGPFITGSLPAGPGALADRVLLVVLRVVLRLTG